MKLDVQDLSFAVRRLPSCLKRIMKTVKWQNKIYVGGGYVRSVICNDKINDVDVFVQSIEDAEAFAEDLKKDLGEDTIVIKSKNAITIRAKKDCIQIVYRWLFQKPEDVALSFDFTVCCAVIFVTRRTEEVIEEGKNKIKESYYWDSFVDDRFYLDIASKRLIYRVPERNEDAGGSMLRVLKYYQKGYRIPIDSLAKVIARLMRDIDTNKLDLKDEVQTAKVIKGFLRMVDPNIEPLMEGHLPDTEINIKDFIKE